jgi:excisionase family DNA binding protein
MTTAPPEPAPLLWTTTQAAARLNVSRAWVQELIARGELESIKSGRRRLIPDAALHRYIAARLAEAASW